MSLTPIEREMLEEGLKPLKPCHHDIGRDDDFSPEEQKVVDDLAARGLIIWEDCSDGKDYIHPQITELGKEALRQDTLNPAVPAAPASTTTPATPEEEPQELPFDFDSYNKIPPKEKR